MKKQFIFLFALIMMATSSIAQVSLVPRAGVSISNVAMDNDNFFEDGRKNQIGFVGGLGLNFALTEDEFLSIQPELLYVQKGFASEGSSLLGSYDYTYRLNYLELPVLLKIGFGTDVIRGYVNLGPSVGYLLNGQVKGSGEIAGLVGGSVDEKIEFTKSSTNDPTELHANRIEFGASFGGGIGISLGGRSMLFVDARYNAGLTNFDKDNKSKNQPIYLTAGFNIPLGMR